MSNTNPLVSICLMICSTILLITTGVSMYNTNKASKLCSPQQSVINGFDDNANKFLALCKIDGGYEFRSSSYE